MSVIPFPSSERVLLAQYAVTPPGRILPTHLRPAERSIDFLRRKFPNLVQDAVNACIEPYSIDGVSYEPAQNASHAAPGQAATDIIVTTRRRSHISPLRAALAEHWEDDQLPFFDRYLDVVTHGSIRLAPTELYICVGHLIVPSGGPEPSGPGPRKIA